MSVLINNKLLSPLTAIIVPLIAFKCIYLSSTDFKVIVVNMDRGDSVARWRLLHGGIRETISCRLWHCNLTLLFNFCFLLLSCLMKPAQGQHHNVCQHHHVQASPMFKRQNLPVCLLVLWQIWQSFSWDPGGFPSLSGPQQCTSAESTSKCTKHNRSMSIKRSYMKRIIKEADSQRNSLILYLFLPNFFFWGAKKWFFYCLIITLGSLIYEITDVKFYFLESEIY